MQPHSNKIVSKINKASKQNIFFAEDFSNITTSENIRQVLSRLEKEGYLLRIAHGIYLRPKKDENLGILYPSTDEIAKEIAKRDKARIAPTGSLATYMLGLTTQMPLNPVYLTDGSQRIVKINNKKIKFKNVVPKIFAIKNKLLLLLVQAIKEVGKNNISIYYDKLEKNINELPQKVIDSELKYAPIWVQKEIKQLRK